LTTTITVNGRTPSGLFDDPVDDMIRAYIQAKWIITSPDISTNPPADFSTKVRFADFDYDYFSTYHVMVKQDESTTFDNDLVGQGLLQFFDPVLIEISARRLTYGKTFEELDNIRLEIIRILEQYQADSILGTEFMSGVAGIQVLEPGDIGPEQINVGKLPRSIWRAQVKALVYYSICYF